MTVDVMLEKFSKYDDEYHAFDRVTGDARLSNRPDLCAFLLLDKLVPGTGDMVSASEHDEFFLDVSHEELAASSPSDEDIITLVRCGVRFRGEYDLLSMYA